jgi:hypothetical protein
MRDMAAWANTLYSEGVDRKDAKAFAGAFTEDGWLRFGNNEPIIGREAIEQAITGFFSMFESLQHESNGTTFTNGTLVLEANVTYTLFGGGTVTVPACTIFRFADTSGEHPLAHRCQIYVDLAPLFSAVQNAAH